jgi:hypothetical protein
MLPGTSTQEIRDAAREIKFVVDRAAAAEILAWTRARLAPDINAGGEFGDAYHTSTLYFDTPAFAVYQRLGSYRRSKYRIRCYGGADMVFLERKLRTAALLSKRRTSMPMAGLPGIFEAGSDPRWPGSWFTRRLEARRLSPVCQVSYRRHARVGAGTFGPLRVTFDEGLVARPNQGLTFEPEDTGCCVLEASTIVEIKFRVDMPAVLRQLVETFALEPASISKYRLSMDALRRAGAPVGGAFAALDAAFSPGAATTSPPEIARA